MLPSEVVFAAAGCGLGTDHWPLCFVTQASSLLKPSSPRACLSFIAVCSGIAHRSSFNCWRFAGVGIGQAAFPCIARDIPVWRPSAPPLWPLRFGNHERNSKHGLTLIVREADHRFIRRPYLGGQFVLPPPDPLPPAGPPDCWRVSPVRRNGPVSRGRTCSECGAEFGGEEEGRPNLPGALSRGGMRLEGSARADEHTGLHLLEAFRGERCFQVGSDLI